MKKTLLYHSADPDSILAHVEDSLSELESMKLIIRDDFSSYRTTKLGEAIVISSLDPEDGIFIHEELSRALQAFVMDGDMHVLYTFTPVNDLVSSINWRVFWTEMEQFDESALRVLMFLGLKPTVVNKMYVILPST